MTDSPPLCTPRAVVCQDGQVDNAPAQDLLSALTEVGRRLDELSFPLDVSTAEEDRQRRDRVVHQIENYLIPRARTLDSPLTIVIGGSTGAGKSTLVNSLLREAVTTSGVVRPTTRNPVLVHHPEDAAWIGRDRLLPALPRWNGPATGEQAAEGAAEAEGLAGLAAGPGPAALRTAATTAVPEGIVLIDAPDIDSVSEANRRLSRQLLDAADFWLFVTTAHRYADAVPWELLHRAAQRNIGLAIILNRAPEEDAEEIAADLRRLLAESGLNPQMLVTVHEQSRDERGWLPEQALAPLSGWLTDLGRDAKRRSELAGQSLRGAVGALDEELAAVIAGAEAQEQARAELVEIIERQRSQSRSRLLEAVSDGEMLRGEVLARWQDFVGTGAWFRRLEAGVGRLRDQLGNYLRGGPQQAQRLEDELETGLYRVIAEEAAQAAETVQAEWQRHPAARELLDGRDLGVLPEDYPWQVQEQIRAWQAGILDMMGSEGAHRRQRARFLSAGLNAGAVLLMIVVFSMTGGLTGIEAGIAGGAGALGWKLLEAVFGEDAVRRMARRAREDLLACVDRLLIGALRPFLEEVPADQQPGLDQARGARDGLLAAARDHTGTRAPAPDAAAARRLPWQR